MVKKVVILNSGRNNLHVKVPGVKFYSINREKRNNQEMALVLVEKALKSSLHSRNARFERECNEQAVRVVG